MKVLSFIALFFSVSPTQSDVKQHDTTITQKKNVIEANALLKEPECKNEPYSFFSFFFLK
ncbi:MAG: hypothetical protein ACPGLV_03195 [Bacteroidia bacterium]